MVTRQQDTLPVSACLCLRNQVTTKQQWHPSKGGRRYWTVVVHFNTSLELTLISYCKYIHNPPGRRGGSVFFPQRMKTSSLMWWKTFQCLTLCLSSLLCLLSFFLPTILQDDWPLLSHKRWASSQWNLGVLQKKTKQNKKHNNLHTATWQPADTTHSAEDSVILSWLGGLLSHLNCCSIGWLRRHTYAGRGSWL